MQLSASWNALHVPRPRFIAPSTFVCLSKYLAFYTLTLIWPHLTRLLQGLAQPSTVEVWAYLQVEAQIPQLKKCSWRTTLILEVSCNIQSFKELAPEKTLLK